MTETIFTYVSPALKFGAGAAQELSYDLRAWGVRRVLVITDPQVAALGHTSQVVAGLADDGLEVVTYDQVGVEPTDGSLQAAAEFAREQLPWDAIVAVGGGSTIDTAKAINLLASDAGELMEYINPPIGAGRAPQQPLKPLVALPTTTGTGAESTTVCVLDVTELQVKTGISHEQLRPQLAIVDPTLSVTQPAPVIAAAGLDVLCHALESYTARPYTAMPKKSPAQRVPYCGANPISDGWAGQALTIMGQVFRTAVHDAEAVEARSQMALAATVAGLGFGNAGVHLPHANAYPIGGLVRDYYAPGYPQSAPLIPHGIAVALTAPEVFRRTYPANPARHEQAAAWLQPGREHQGPDALPQVLIELMADIGVPAGLSQVGFTEADIPALVAGSLRQQRLLSLSPVEVDAQLIGDIMAASMRLW